MLQSATKTLWLGVIACLAIPLMAMRAGADGLQPQALNHSGITALKQIEPSLTGADVKFAVISRSITYINGEPQNDYRPDTQHNCLIGKDFTFYDRGKQPAGTSPHSTAICSILFGEDPDASNAELGQFSYQGATPQAEADIYEFWHFLINNVFGLLPPDADILTASIGNQSEDWWTRGIESMVQHHGLIVVAGIGNGSRTGDPVLYPAAGSNIIGVGVVNSVNTENPATNLSNFALAYPEYSSFGPTGDGRCKPDIVAPGNCLAADGTEPNHYEATGNWSSFSTPIVAGTIGLLVEKAKQDPSLSMAVEKNGGNCVMKAILLNSARKLPYWHKGRLEKDDDHKAPLDYIQGAGMLNALGAYEHLIAGQNRPGEVPTTGWDLNRLQKDRYPVNTYKITLAEPADKFITATIAWNRNYKSTYPFEPVPEKDANLRLELWAIDAEDANNDYLLDYSDSAVDNVEHIYAAADANYTDYEIAITYSNIDDPNQLLPAQRYGLAWNVSEKQNSKNIFWYDLNADGIVNESDFKALTDNWLTSITEPEWYVLGDINSDGEVDSNDLQIFFDNKDLKANWNTE